MTLYHWGKTPFGNEALFVDVVKLLGGSTHPQLTSLHERLVVTMHDMLRQQLAGSQHQLEWWQELPQAGWDNQPTFSFPLHDLREVCSLPYRSCRVLDYVQELDSEGGHWHPIAFPSRSGQSWKSLSH